jgi:hypothetical protein
MRTPNKELIEHRFKESIDAYVAIGRPVGSFLEAVISNDLSGAIGRADVGALENIPHIVAYLYNDVPGNAWGSKMKYQEWITKFYVDVEKV